MSDLYEHPTIAATRAARTAVRLAGDVEHALVQLSIGDTARTVELLRALRDGLGQQHVSCDELADQLRELLPHPIDADLEVAA